MSSAQRLFTVGRVGRPHGRDGAFWVEDVHAEAAALACGAEVVLAGRRTTVARRAGTRVRPLLRLEALSDREAVAAHRGEALLVAENRAPLGADEWLAKDLVGLHVDGLGEVRRVLGGPSCDVLEVGEQAVLVPLVRDAVRCVDLARGRIEVDLAFLDLSGEGDPEASTSPP